MKRNSITRQAARLAAARIRRQAEAVGNDHMHQAGRTEWSDADWQAAAVEMIRLKQLARRGQLSLDLGPPTAPG